MDKVIRVKGTGKVSVPPDLIEISLTIKGTSRLYHKAMEIAGKKLTTFKEKIVAIGFNKEDLKTTNFQVNSNYERLEVNPGTYKNVFTGFTCHHDLLLSFDFNQEQLGKTLEVLAKGSEDLEFHVSFTIKNSEAVTNEMLEKAAEDALKKAKILCAASKVTLGQLINIDYSWNEIALYSPTNYSLSRNMKESAVAFSSMEFVPEDVESTDTATFIWEIN